MAEESEFISRTGTIRTDAGKVFDFVTDVRNFSRFVPDDVFKNWSASSDECSFEMAPLGSASVRIVEKDPGSMVKYEGSAFSDISFRLWFQIRESQPGITRFRIVIRAALNPLYKIMAAHPVNEFLEKVVSGIENFENWEDVVTDTQSP